MAGKGARERRRQRDIARIEAINQREAEYLANGGIKHCKTCFGYSRCPVYGDEIMPCWAFNGMEQTNEE